MKKMYSVVGVVALLAGLIIVGCSQEADSPISPSLENGEKNLNSSSLQTSAVRSAGCYGSSCEGKNPQLYGCNDHTAYVVESKEIRYNGQLVGWIELKYSGSCNANWARVVRHDGWVGYNIKAEVVGSSGSYEADIGGSQWDRFSDMINGSQSAWACGMICMDGGYPSCASGYNCTGAY
jgi:hypothetical protein